MLARTLGPKFSQWPAYVQPKLNGIRALYQNGTFQSRDEKVWKYNVLAHITKEFQDSNIDFVLGNPPGQRILILDGELYFHSWRLQRINSAIAVNRHDPTHDTLSVEFHVFDVVNPKLPFSERYLPIANLLREANLPHIRAVDTTMVHDREQLERYFELCVRDGFEGAMVRPDGMYEFGEHMGRGGTLTQYRSKTLWKYKSWEDGEFVCVGTTQGEGKADIGVGALVLSRTGADQLKRDWSLEDVIQFSMRPNESFKVGTGLTDEDRIAFAENPPIGKLVKIRYLCLTEDGIPFNPSFLAVLA